MPGWVWIAAAVVLVFLGSWWVVGDWRSAAVSAAVIGTPLVALGFVTRRRL